MLSLTLLLLTAPQAPAAALPTEPPAVPASRRLAEVREQLAGSSDASRRCHNVQVQRAVGPVQPLVNDLLYRDTDEVRGWLLLERSIKGCSTPISWPHSRGAIEATPAPSPPVRAPR